MYLFVQKLLWHLCSVCLTINYLNSMFNWLHVDHKNFLIMTTILTSLLWCCFQTAAYFKQDYVCESFSPLVRVWKLHCWATCIWEFSSSSFKHNRVIEFWVVIFPLKILLIFQCLLKLVIHKEYEVKLTLFLCMQTLFFPAWMSLVFLLIHAFQKFHQAL